MEKCFEGSFTKTISTTVSTLLIVMHHPLVKISLQRFQVLIKFSTEGDSVELILHRPVQSLADSIALRMADLGSAVIDIFKL